uniref:Uncharacterized protein n=1 Tax=Cyanothece sp. (strain PCC 7425 / ATCC 29141) TaxID=395961 RepID=B8HYZ4_CYAP4
MSTPINLDNCAADLENLAYEICQYLQMKDICDEQEQVNRQFAIVLRNLKNTSIIYTDVVAQAMAAKPVLPIVA